MKYSNPIDTNFHFISNTKEQFDEKIKSFVNNVFGDDYRFYLTESLDEVNFEKMDLMLKNLKFSSLKLNVESSKFFKEKTEGSSEYNISFIHRFIINQGIDKIFDRYSKNGNKIYEYKFNNEFKIFYRYSTKWMIFIDENTLNIGRERCVFNGNKIYPKIIL